MTKEEVIRTAVKWWLDKVCSKVPHNNGDSNSSSILACLFADMGAEDVTRSQAIVFDMALTHKIEAMYAENFEKRAYQAFMIGCDYHPCVELYDAAKEAGISEMNFPFKTWMRIGKDFVEVSDGYAKPFVRLDI